MRHAHRARQCVVQSTLDLQRSGTSERDLGGSRHGQRFGSRVTAPRERVVGCDQPEICATEHNHVRSPPRRSLRATTPAATHRTARRRGVPDASTGTSAGRARFVADGVRLSGPRPPAPDDSAVRAARAPLPLPRRGPPPRQQARAPRRCRRGRTLRSRVEQLLALALALGDRAARPLHVGARARVAVIEEQHARPHADRELVAGRRNNGRVRTRSSCSTRASRSRSWRIGRWRGPVGAKRVGHQSSWKRGVRRRTPAIMSARHARVRQRTKSSVSQLWYNPARCRSSSRSPTSARAAAPRSSSAWPTRSGPRRACGCSTTPPMPSHNRSVFTLAGDAGGDPGRRRWRCSSARVAAIDLRSTTGEHPRLGAVDVVPFVPIEGVTMADCVALATRRRRARVAEPLRPPGLSLRRGVRESGAPEPGRHPPRRIRGARPRRWRRPDGRRTSARRRRTRAPARSVDRRAHAAHRLQHQPRRPTGSTSPRRSPRPIRQSSGGLRYVKAMGIALEDRGIVQVSMNLTNYEKTPIFRVFELGQARGRRATASTCSRARSSDWCRRRRCVAAAEYYLQLDGSARTRCSRTSCRKT